MNGDATTLLFAYGTLQDEAVQLATFGRKLAGQADSLVGYRLVMVEIEDQDFAASNGAQQRSLLHTNRTSDFVEGTAFSVSQKELDQADEYEPTDYLRVNVQLRSGRTAWMYVHKDQVASS